MRTKALSATLALLLVAAITVLPGCRAPRVKLRNIPAGGIPSQFTSFMANKSSADRTSNIVWRTYMDDNYTNATGVTAAVCTATEGSRDVMVIILSEEAERRMGARIEAFPPSSTPFFASTSSYGDRDLHVIIDAAGTALDSRISKVVATANDGTTVEVQPIDGFWYLRYFTEAPGDQWTEFKALDAKGKTLYVQKTGK